MIAFVILHYQAIEETKDCVRAIKQHISTNKKIIIVDNHSPNKSGADIQKLYIDDLEVEVLLLESNMGFAKGNNLGYKAAKKYSPDYVVVMNNDVFIERNRLEEQLDASYKQYSFDILGPDIYSTRDNTHQNPQKMSNFSYKSLKSQYSILKIKNRLRFFVRIKYLLPFLKHGKQIKKEFLNEPIENVVLHGACYIYSKKFILNHDCCLYDGTFMYYESYILHLLANREGLKLLYDPRIKVLHHEDVATDMTFGKKYSKAVFTNKCLLDSCGIFINILKDEKIRIG